jgi:hypothetical protein
MRNTLSFHFSPFLESHPLFFLSTPGQNLEWHLVQGHVIIDIWHRPKNWMVIFDMSSKSVFKIIVCVLNWKINHNGTSSLFSLSIQIHYFKSNKNEWILPVSTMFFLMTIQQYYPYEEMDQCPWFEASQRLLMRWHSSPTSLKSLPI